MTRILLTGGSGFIATHIIEILLKSGHSVVTTVRSQEKADKLKAAFSGSEFGSGQLEFAFVKDIAQPDAFHNVLHSDPPFEAVIHTASPFQFNVTDVQKELLDPAVKGTEGVLKQIKKDAPSVKHVVITSSFAALCDPSKGNWPEHTYSEADWNPMALEQALANSGAGYTASKAFAEKAAWQFMENEKPNFSLTTICPTLVFGPIVPAVHSLSSLNTSNQLIFGITQGMAKEKIPDMGGYNFVDVRDVAKAHVEALSQPEAANKRFFLTGGGFNNRKIVEIVAKNFSEYNDAMPAADVEGGNYPPEGVSKTDNSRSKEVLGIQYHGLEEAVVDTVKSFQAAQGN